MLNREWKRRIEMWINQLPKYFYKKIGDLNIEGYITEDFLTLDEAMQGNFEPFEKGRKWGDEWKYAWFKCDVALPKIAKGHKIVAKMDIGEGGGWSNVWGGHSTVYVNGKSAGTLDYKHKDFILSDCSDGSEKFEIVLEAYCGHPVPGISKAGPVSDEFPVKKEKNEEAPVIGDNSYGFWYEEIYQLWLDATVLLELRNILDENSLRVSRIDSVLKKLTLVLDFEECFEKLLSDISAARELLKPELNCVNGSTAPTMYAVGHSHLDLAWLWPVAETKRKCARTIANQLSLMRQYPEYKYIQSQPFIYEVIKEHYPSIYKEIREFVKKGQFIPEGGMYVEADTNITGGESLIRQFLYGKQFFKEEFGIDSKILWLPDVFGYSANMPQIMKGCGIEHFFTAKIIWNYNEVSFPYELFHWQGIDGTQIDTTLLKGYMNETKPSEVLKNWNERNQKDGYDARVFAYGFGDGGGGATRNDVEYLRRESNLEGLPRVISASPNEYVSHVSKSEIAETYVGELYFACHRGVFTAQAKIKKGNRKCEFALREAEFWGSLTNVKSANLKDAWKKVLFNQFHDILPGSSIKRVYDEVEGEYREIMEQTERFTHDALKTVVSDSSNALSIFNSLSWERKALIKLPASFDGAADAEGNRIPVQDGYALVRIPPCGYTTVYNSADEEKADVIKADGNVLENNMIKVTFNEKGEISSVFDKEAGREILTRAGNSFRMYKDVPTMFDAWDIDSMYHMMPVSLGENAEITALGGGELFSALIVKRKINNSFVTQKITLQNDSRRIDFETVVDWQETHKLLKVEFPCNFNATEAMHEIQFGYIKRPTHKSTQDDKDKFEVPQQKWTALANEHYGCAVLNDCKYGVSVENSNIELSLLRAPMAPAIDADKGIQEFTYSFYVWNGGFKDSDVERQAYQINVKPIVKEGEAGQKSYFSVDKNNIIIDTVKKAEDGDGIIVRMYETKNTETAAQLHLGMAVKSACETNMLEEYAGDLKLSGSKIKLNFRPFEIKTVKLKVDKNMN